MSDRPRRNCWTIAEQAVGTTPGMMQHLLERAKWERVTVEGFDFDALPKLPAAQIRDLAALRWLHAGESVILYGPVGVGKTHIAQALGHVAIRQGADVRFLETSRALADLAGGHADRTWQRRLKELNRPAVLILDDFGMREPTASQADTSMNSSTNAPAAASASPATAPRSTGIPSSLTPSSPNSSWTGSSTPATKSS
ncbi:hypothetical protein amrb99_42550 [Actinomadura sp. RB99]|uniref:ATP-binding protein n=1 Tax=Actinomadura sp. RB99 TaxID=2691577 RepID=UPI0019BC8CCC|nr:ATP-binding protein [Actinomadura sp. RB99]MBD2895320.1 hypothetical protein [Actinomadura sp. RB99]